MEIDPDTEVVTTIGAKEGLSHLMWALVGPGDTALVPTPSYPIHIYAPLFAGADVQQVRLGPDQDFFANLIDSWESTWPRPRVIVFSFPHNPTTECVDLAWMARIVDFAREHDVVLVHDFAYSDTAFDGYPAAIASPGPRSQGRRRRAVHADQELLDGGLAGGLRASVTPQIVAALTKLKSYLDYGTFQPIQIASIVTLNEAPDYPKVVNEIYQSRRNASVDGLNASDGTSNRPGAPCSSGRPIPEPYREMGSLEFSKYLVTEAEVATSPGVGFGKGGEGFVRFALIENEQRIQQSVRNLRRVLTKLG